MYFEAVSGHLAFRIRVLIKYPTLTPWQWTGKLLGVLEGEAGSAYDYKNKLGHPKEWNIIDLSEAKTSRMK